MKTKLTEIRDALAFNYAEEKRAMAKILNPQNGNTVSKTRVAITAFKAGWDARDKIDNEALIVAIEALEAYASWSSDDEGAAIEALAKIKELRGEK